MGETEYSEALKLGKKEYRARIAKGQFPYLPVLDEILSEADIQTEQNMGLVQVPLDFVVGTSTMGRTYSFAANFMPILDEETEFAVKWSNLSDAQMNEGIRDPIKAFEYMNRYYVLEGNKRVSVLKYFNAVSIPAIVIRKIPKLSDDYDVRLYYEYMRFNEITGLCSVEFTKLGNADKLLSLVGKEGRWDDETKEKFAKVMFDFSKVYNFRGGDRLDIKLGDAITVFMEVFGMDAMLEMSESDYNKNIINTWKEFAAEGEKHKINLVLDPTKVQTKKSLLNYLIPQTPKKLKVVFLYPREPKTSAWLYSHELGRNYLDDTFSDRLETEFVSGVDESNVEQVLEDIKQRDYNDTHRETAPLKKADDAIEVDSTKMSLKEVIDTIVGIIKDKTKSSGNGKSGGEKVSSKASRELMPPRPISKKKHLNFFHLFFYNFLRYIVIFLYHCFYNIKWEGKENVPKDGGNIFASNHRSYQDPVFTALGARIPISYMAKEELFHKNIFFTALIKFFGAFPVERGKGDMTVIDTSIEKLENGRNLEIFPEGTRSKDGKVGKGKTGVALVAAVAQTKVVPVGINFKGEKLKFRSKVVIRYGKPIIPSEIGVTGTTAKDLKIIKNEIMKRITELVH